MRKPEHKTCCKVTVSFLQFSPISFCLSESGHIPLNAEWNFLSNDMHDNILARGKFWAIRTWNMRCARYLKLPITFQLMDRWSSDFMCNNNETSYNDNDHKNFPTSAHAQNAGNNQWLSVFCKFHHFIFISSRWDIYQWTQN